MDLINLHHWSLMECCKLVNTYDFTAIGKPSVGKLNEKQIPIAKKLRAHIK